MDVRDFVSTCERCQRADTRFQKSAPNLHSIPVPMEPWKQVGVDICSLSDGVDGYKYMIVMVDYFTKWVEAKPLKSKSADEVALFIFETFCRLGSAAVQINDQGREFVNQVSKLLHSMYGTKQHITSAYHPQSNGLVERNNRTVQNWLLRVLAEKHDEWPKALPGVVCSYNTSKNKTTLVTPFYLMYGRKARIPLDSECLDGDDDCEEVPTTDIIVDVDDQALTARISAINDVRERVFPKVAANIKVAQERQARDYRKRHISLTPFIVGAQVFVWNQKRADRKGGKHVDSWIGPYIVSKVLDNGNYELTNSSGTVIKKQMHGSNLKLHRLKPAHLIPQQQRIASATDTTQQYNAYEDVDAECLSGKTKAGCNGDDESDCSALDDKPTGNLLHTMNRLIFDMFSVNVLHSHNFINLHNKSLISIF